MLSIYGKLIQVLLDKGLGSVDHELCNEELIDLRKSLLKHKENIFFHFAGEGSKENLPTIKDTHQIQWFDPFIADASMHGFLEKINGFIGNLIETCFAGIDEFQYAIFKKGFYYNKLIAQYTDDNKKQYSIAFYLSTEWKMGQGGKLRL